MPKGYSREFRRPVCERLVGTRGRLGAVREGRRPLRLGRVRTPAPSLDGTRVLRTQLGSTQHLASIHRLTG